MIVGLMSGTSADGIAAAAVRFAPGALSRIEASLLAHRTTAYTLQQRERLLAAMRAGDPAEYCALGFDLGGWLARAALDVMDAAGLAAADVDAIASHGQTLWHVPAHSSWQVGQPAVIAERTGVGVVSDFRARDIAAGGQGAPLVPIADALLFASPLGWRALQNLGGIGNVSVVPAGGALVEVRAFDTGPGCAVIDAVTRSLVPEMSYDVDGLLASAGQPVRAAVDAALEHPYFAASPPKSTGRELFSEEYVAAFLRACRDAAPCASNADLIASAVALTAGSIALAYERFVPEPVVDVVLSGGGARNPALVRAIEAALAPRVVRCFDELFFDAEAKEAVAFALLGYLFLESRPGNVPGATGARGARLLGTWCPP